MSLCITCELLIFLLLVLTNVCSFDLDFENLKCNNIMWTKRLLMTSEQVGENCGT